MHECHDHWDLTAILAMFVLKVCLEMVKRCPAEKCSYAPVKTHVAPSNVSSQILSPWTSRSDWARKSSAGDWADLSRIVDEWSSGGHGSRRYASPGPCLQLSQPCIISLHSFLVWHNSRMGRMYGQHSFNTIKINWVFCNLLLLTI